MRAAFVLLVLLLAGCAHWLAYNRAVESEERGDFFGASEAAIEALEQQRNYPEAKALLERTWPVYYTSASGQINTALADRDWDTAVSRFQQLMPLARRVAPLGLGVPLPDLETRYRETLEKAAAAYYDQGSQLEATQPRDAARAFRRAEALIPGYRDAATRYELARQSGLVNVAVLPFQNAIAGELHHKLYAKLLDRCLTSSLEFVHFTDNAGDYQVKGELVQMQATIPRDEIQYQEVEEAMPDGQGGYYQARASFHHRQITNRVVVSATVRLYEKERLVLSKNLTETVSDQTEWIENAQGDRRALKQWLQLETASHFPRSHAELYDQATSQLADQFFAEISNYLARSL